MSDEKMKWSVENTCKLIELYREARFLWDADHPDYKNRYKKVEALKVIGIFCDASPAEVDRKIKNINTQYQREHRNHQLLKKSGADKTFVSKWFGYRLLSFLQDRNKSRSSGNIGVLANTQEGDGSNSDEEAEEPESNRHNTSSASDGASMEETQIKDEDPHGQMEFMNYTQTTDKANKNLQANSNTHKRVSTYEERSAEIFGMLQGVYRKNQQATSVQPDDFDIFGELVARKLRKLNTPYAQATVQHLINNLLYDAEIGKYDTPTKTERADTIPPFSISSCSSL